MPSVSVPFDISALPRPGDRESGSDGTSFGGEGRPAGVDRAQLNRFFGADGFLAKLMARQGREFEARPEQMQMAAAVTNSIRERSHLLVEAGTGTGKSYAYLIPFLLWAIENHKKVLVATGTKALQQQLVERDLPFISELFQQRLGQEVRYALCLGTGNYVCPRRLAKAQGTGLFGGASELEQLGNINQFARQSPTGRNLDMAFEPSPAIWGQVNRESDLCLGRNCPTYDLSFFYKARKEQERAHILVANHHLLFAHLAAGGNVGGVLPAFDAVVIDEAHQAEDVAAAYLGLEVSNLGAARLVELVANRRSSRTVLHGARWPEAQELEKKLHEAAAEAREAVARFFGNVQEVVKFDPGRSSNIRIRQRDIVEDCLTEPFARIESLLKEGRLCAERESDDALTRELEGFGNRCGEFRRAVRAIVEQSESGYVYWASAAPRLAEEPGRGARVPRLALHGAPVEVGPAMQKNLFQRFRPAVLTSATLTTGGSFEFLKERLGLALPPESEPEVVERVPVRTLVLGSPFDFRENVLLYLALDLPDPSHAAHWEAAAVQRAAEVVERTNGRAFVLCTSFRIVDQTARVLQKVLPSHIKVLRQGEVPRGKLLSQFREDIHSVLVGTTSFWQGVDVPGESLSCVVIMKLPFAVPDEPLVAARVESLQARGRNAFVEYQVPQAVMMFRQGFGRLIRTAHDRGVVAILDPRVRTKRYGATFLDSLPSCDVTQDLDRVSTFCLRS